MDVDNPSTPRDDDAADAPVVLDENISATSYDAPLPAGAPTVQDFVDPVIPDAIALASSDDEDPVVPGVDAPNCDGRLVMLTADAPMTSRG